MNKPCKHADGGCNYPEGDCAGYCHFPVKEDLQPEALRLADLLTDSHLPVHHKAAAELRRLYEESVQMRDQRDELLEALQSFPGFTDDAAIGDPWLEQMRSAIAKVTGGAS